MLRELSHAPSEMIPNMLIWRSRNISYY